MYLTEDDYKYRDEHGLWLIVYINPKQNDGYRYCHSWGDTEEEALDYAEDFFLYNCEPHMPTALFKMDRADWQEHI